MRLIPWVLRPSGSIDLAKTLEAVSSFGRRVEHPRAGVSSSPVRGACVRAGAREEPAKTIRIPE